MSKTRLEAFSDGVIAIIITIMVLELKIPHDTSWAALRELTPTFLTYALSFAYVGIYWNNHHHMLHMTDRVNGAILWANLHLLFWLSLTPFTTGWMGENHFAAIPTAVYGIDLLLCAVAYTILQQTIIRSQGPHSRLAAATRGGLKEYGSLACYVAAIAMAFVDDRVSDVLYVTVALIWLVPDRRIERHITAAPATD